MNTQRIAGEAKPTLLLFSPCNKRLLGKAPPDLCCRILLNTTAPRAYRILQFFQCSAAGCADHPVPRALLVLKFTEKGSLELED